MKIQTRKRAELSGALILACVALASCEIPLEDQIPCREAASEGEIVQAMEIVRDKWSTYLTPPQIAFMEESSRIEFYQCGGKIYVLLTQLPFILDEFGREHAIVDGFDQILEIVDLKNARVL